MKFLLDTYALIEWYAQGNQNYAPYFKLDVERHITKTTLLEFYCQIYHNLGEKKAETYYSYITAYAEITELTEDIIKSAAVFRSKMMKKKKKLSYGDCINYITACKIGAKFVTGDKEFEELENVEFVR
ncbi:MAG: PIN domain-containing protein [Candidatus Thermoplasmatota archaeon]